MTQLVRLTPGAYGQSITRFGVPEGTPLDRAYGTIIGPISAKVTMVTWQGRGRPIGVPNRFLQPCEGEFPPEAVYTTN